MKQMDVWRLPPTKRIYFSASFEDGDPVSHQAKVITRNTWIFSLTAVEYFITTPRHTLKLLIVLCTGIGKMKLEYSKKSETTKQAGL